MRALAILALATTASAQTFIVDAANQPGTNFLDLPAAVAAVPDGAVLIVRQGSYSGFTLSAKGITILGDPAASVAGVIAIDSTAPNQPVTLRQLTWTTNPMSGTFLIDLDRCAGSVLLEELTLPAGFYSGFAGGGVAARDCGRLTLRACHLLCRVNMRDSCGVIDSCFIRGEDYTLNFSFRDGVSAVSLDGGWLQVTGATSIRGGDGFIGGPARNQPGNGIIVFDGDLRVLGGSVSSGGLLSGSNPVFGSAIVAYNVPEPRVSPRVTLASLGTFWPPVPNDDVMPQLTGAGAPPGGNFAATVETEDGDLAILAVGLPGPPVTIAGIVDPFWLDPTVHAFVAIGTHTAASPIMASVPVPSNPGFLGVCLNWQAACYGSVTGLQATNPVVTLVR